MTGSKTTPDGKTTPIYDNSPFGDRITAQAAKQAFGEKAFNAAQISAIPGRAEFFNRALRDDRKGWAKAAGETALLAVPVSKAYELYKAIGDVALGAYNLYRDIKEARHPEQ